MDFTNLGNNMRVTLESMRSASGNYIAFGGLLDLRSYSLPRLQQLYDRLSQFRESAPATQSSERCQREAGCFETVGSGGVVCVPGSQADMHLVWRGVARAQHATRE